MSRPPWHCSECGAAAVVDDKGYVRDPCGHAAHRIYDKTVAPTEPAPDSVIVLPAEDYDHLVAEIEATPLPQWFKDATERNAALASDTDKADSLSTEALRASLAKRGKPTLDVDVRALLDWWDAHGDSVDMPLSVAHAIERLRARRGTP